MLSFGAVNGVALVDLKGQHMTCAELGKIRGDKHP
jgi:hypothetical protein